MVRAALASRRRIGQGPVQFATAVPAASVVVASLLCTLPIISNSGWYPDFGFLVLISWRLLRADPWPAWWTLPMGLVNDLFTGAPVGLSIALWSATMLALGLIDRRTMWRGYWTEWVLAAVLLAINEWIQWRIAAVLGADLPFMTILPPFLVSICAFPLSAWVVSRIDRWRLGQ
jgi:rod shape-determining protein MreD